MSQVLKTRSAYVIYVPTLGYMKNKAGEFHADFEHARLYPTEKSANDSVKMNNKLKGYDSYVVGVEMTLDPRILFKKVLQGKK